MHRHVVEMPRVRAIAPGGEVHSLVERHDMSDRYDPYIPSGETPASDAAGGSSRTAQIQAQIDETVGVMRDNINKVNERGENLNSLQDKTGVW